MLIASLSLGNRFIQLAIASVLLIGLVWFLIPSSFDVTRFKTVPDPVSTQPGVSAPDEIKLDLPPKPNHPIDTLVQRAEDEYNALLLKETNTLHDAAQAYRDRRGRQPPPGFDKWFAFAQNNSAVIVEDFFDRIYHDLNPFWGVPAKQIREQANAFPHRVSVRNGDTTFKTDEDRPWMFIWKEMVQTVAQHLPDVDLAINVMDESRMIVPWEEIDGYMSEEKKSRKIVPVQQLKTGFKSLKDMDRNPPEAFDAEFSGMGPYWPLAVIGCPPDSPARGMYIDSDFSKRPAFTTTFPKGSYQGYVQNWTLATSPCDNPALQGMHGTFVEPLSIANTKKFIPLFGGSKLPMNNEILLPAAMYWTDDPFYSGGEDHGSAWAKKKDMLLWRGAASGGRNKEENWTRFQRHRFVSMVNETTVRLTDTVPEYTPLNFDLPANDTYDLAARGPEVTSTDFSDWIKTWSDAAVVHLLCFPGTESKQCWYTDPYFSIHEFMPMKEQYNFKYLPDIDGNSFSGRYRGFLRSTSLPIKATIYNEWHDHRLIPWKHFVPMDNTFIDIYGIMEYFIGAAKHGIGGHDAVAKNIALEGKTWAEKVLRSEDMSIYVFRLILEYARLCDDDRNVLGWAETGIS